MSEIISPIRTTNTIRSTADSEYACKYGLGNIGNFDTGTFAQELLYEYRQGFSSYECVQHTVVWDMPAIWTGVPITSASLTLYAESTKDNNYSLPYTGRYWISDYVGETTIPSTTWKNVYFDDQDGKYTLTSNIAHSATVIDLSQSVIDAMNTAGDNGTNFGLVLTLDLTFDIGLRYFKIYTAEHPTYAPILTIDRTDINHIFMMGSFF